MRRAFVVARVAANFGWNAPAISFTLRDVPYARRDVVIAGWGAATFSAVLASYWVFRPVRDALIVGGNPDRIPWLWTATLIAVTIVSPLWSAALSKRSPRTLVPVAFHVFAACEVVFYFLLHSDLDPEVIGHVFYVWSAVFNLFVVSVLWSLFADLLGATVARNLYGPIAAGGTIGAIIGPLLTTTLVSTIGVAGVLVMSAVLLELAVVGVGQVRRVAEGFEGSLPRAAIERDLPADRAVGGAFDGFKHVVKSPFLAAIVGYVLCTATAATFLYLTQQSIVHDAFGQDKEASAEYFSRVDVFSNIGVLIVQVLVAAPLLRRFGPGIVLCMLPLAQLAGVSTLVTAPSLTALAIVMVVTRTATHGLTRPSRELLFTVVSRDDKYRAKNVIDTMVYRFGDWAASWIALAGVGSVVLIAATVPLVIAWTALATVLGIGFRRRTAKEETS